MRLDERKVCWVDAHGQHFVLTSVAERSGDDGDERRSVAFDFMADNFFRDLDGEAQDVSFDFDERVVATLARFQKIIVEFEQGRFESIAISGIAQFERNPFRVLAQRDGFDLSRLDDAPRLLFRFNDRTLNDAALRSRRAARSC